LESPDHPANKLLSEDTHDPTPTEVLRGEDEWSPVPESGGNQHAGISAPPAVLPCPEAEVQSADECR
jgi:hypothetical protein